MSDKSYPAAWAAYHHGDNKYHAIASTRETMLWAIGDTGHECVLMIPLANIERLVSMRMESILQIVEDVDEVACNHSYYAQLGDAGATKRAIIEAMRNAMSQPECIKSFDCANGDHSDACPCLGHEEADE